ERSSSNISASSFMISRHPSLSPNQASAFASNSLPRPSGEEWKLFLSSVTQLSLLNLQHSYKNSSFPSPRLFIRKSISSGSFNLFSVVRSENSPGIKPRENHSF